MIAWLEGDPATFALFAALISLFVGSFLNVVIHRLPKMMEAEWQLQIAEFQANDETPPATPHPRYNLAVPASHCPHCGYQIRAIENIPIISYLFLRGRCRHCKAAIPLRYPIVEGLTALLSGYAGWHFGFGWAGCGAVIFVWMMVALSFIDLDTQLLPDSLTLSLLWLGLLLNLGATFVPLKAAVIGAAAGYMALWLVFWAFKLITGKEGMGYGDFKLLAAIGAWLGWQALPLVILLSSAVGAIIGIGLIVFGRHRRNIPIPFGPYLSVAGVVALLFGKSLMAAYLGTF